MLFDLGRPTWHNILVLHAGTCVLPPLLHQQTAVEGSVMLCRSDKASDGDLMGIAGTVEEISDVTFSSQPICAFDWSPDRLGLFCCAALDQCLRIGMVTRLQTM